MVNRRAMAVLAIALCAALAAAQPAAYPFTIEGQVVAITDGDTIKVLRDQKQYKIRLNGIDAPEKAQAFGQKSKAYLSSLVFGKNVSVIVRDTDRYGRYVGDVMLDGRSANAAMVAAGLAWFYAAYSKDQSLARLEREARAQRLGLWADTAPTPPWKYRREKRAKG
jgi:micrococcal nuclease